MEFCNYSPFNRRNKWAASLPASPSRFREVALAGLESGKPWVHRDIDRTTSDYCSMLVEDVWCKNLRPFYNVWPPVLDMAATVDLRSVTVDQLRIPCGVLLIRLPVSSRLQWMLAVDSRAGKSLMEHGITLTYKADCGGEGQMWLNFGKTIDSYESLGDPTRRPLDFAEHHAKVSALKLLAIVCLLADDPRIIQPIVLAKDRREWMETTDHDRRRLLEERSVRKQGAGFDVGREWHETGDTSPHFRNAHLCLFWTGTNRDTPVVKLRKGCMVQPRKVLEIPTGYLGPEDADLEVVGA